jgi:hypothetical protein
MAGISYTTTDSTTDAVWNTWVGYGSPSDTTTAVSYNGSTTNDVWRVWVGGTYDTGTYNNAGNDINIVPWPFARPDTHVYPPAEQPQPAKWGETFIDEAARLTDEDIQAIREENERQQAARRALVEEQRLEAEKKAQEEELARATALEALKDHLNPEQEKEFREHKSFIVKTSLGTSYRIKEGRSGNIEELDKDGKKVARLCVHPTMRVPDFDTMLTQKVWLEANPKYLIDKANRTPLL